MDVPAPVRAEAQEMDDGGKGLMNSWSVGSIWEMKWLFLYRTERGFLYYLNLIRLNSTRFVKFVFHMIILEM